MANNNNIIEKYGYLKQSYEWPANAIPSTSDKYEPYTWNIIDWQTGETITEDKLESIELGLAISMTRLAAIEAEIGGSLGPEMTQLNSSKIDAILNEIGGTYSNGQITGNSNIDNNATNITTNLNSIKLIKQWISGINDGNYTGNSISKRLTDLEETTGGQTTDITSITNWITGSNTGSYSGNSIASRLTDKDNLDEAHNAKINALAAELGTSFTGNDLGTSHIDNLIKLILGRTYDSTSVPNQTQLLTATNGILTWINGNNTDNYDATKGSIGARLASNEESINNILTELGIASGSNGYSNTNIDKLIQMIWGSAKSSDSSLSVPENMSGIVKWIIGDNTNYTNSEDINARLTSLEDEFASGSTIEQAQNNIQTLANELSITLNGAAQSNPSSKLDTIINNIWSGDNGSGTATDLTNESRIDKLEKEIIGSGNGYDDSRLDKIETELDLENNTFKRLERIEREICGAIITKDNQNGGYSNSRIDNLQNTIGADNVPNTILGRLFAAESTINNQGEAISENSDNITTLQNNMGNYDSDATVTARLSSIETVIGTGTSDTGSISSRLQELQDWKTYLENLHLIDLYNLVTSEYGQVIRMEYTMPFTLITQTLSFNPAKEEVNGVEQFVKKDDIRFICSSHNEWTIDKNSYFVNAGLEFRSPTTTNSNDYYWHGTMSQFKTALNNFFQGIQTESYEGFKISFTFNFTDPLKALRLTFDYGNGQGDMGDVRAYNNENIGWRRISFISKQDESTGSYLPINGIYKLFYGSEDSDEIIQFRDFQLECSPFIDEVEAAVPAPNANPDEEKPDTWVIALPEPMYGAEIDLIDRKIYQTWGYIQSYNGENVGEIEGEDYYSIPSGKPTGAQVVYKFSDEEKLNHSYNMKIRNNIFTQGFNYIPANKTIIRFNKETIL